MAKSQPRKKTPPKSSAKSAPAASPASLSAEAGESPAALRKRLLRLDRELVAQLNQRAQWARALAAAGGGQGVVPASPAAEADEVRRAAEHNEGPLDDRCVRALFRELVSGCRALVQPMRVAYLGPPHSYSHQAAVQRFGQSVDLLPVATIAAVFEAVNRGDVQFGLVPLENSTDGRIADTMEMFARMPVRISGEVQLRIHHYLLAKGRREDVRQVCSKPQAMSQCRNWLSQQMPQAQLVPTDSTAAAAEMAASNASVAAIASRQAGIRYGLTTLADRIEDNPNNATRFAVIGQGTSPRTAHDITSLMFQLKHQPGTLADAMAIFKRNRLNLTWIESFPLQGKSSEYLFFVELEGHETDLHVRRAIESLRAKTDRLEVLGTYGRTDPVE